jgi:hypothetical protein
MVCPAVSSFETVEEDTREGLFFLLGVALFLAAEGFIGTGLEAPAGTETHRLPFLTSTEQGKRVSDIRRRFSRQERNH